VRCLLVRQLCSNIATGYIEGLENRVNTLERLLRSLAPGVDFALLKDAGGATANPAPAKVRPKKHHCESQPLAASARQR
jgi:hypothetical protein